MDSIVFERIYLTALVLETTLTFTTNAKVQIIKLKVDGSIADTSGLPSCYDAGRIDLMSYKYIKNVCTPSSQCNGKESLLSPKAEVLIHQMCSSRDTCISGRFPSWDLKVLGVDAIRVEYRCLDHFETFLDLCTDTSKTIDATIHIRSSNTLETSKECTCLLTGGPFSVILNDVRLSTESGDRCSAASLQVPFHKYTCDNRSENLGSVFNRVVDESTSMYNIRLQTNSRTILPQIVWMTIRTKQSLKVTCNRQPWKLEPLVTKESLTFAQIVNTTNATRTIMEDPGTNSTPTYAVLGAVSILVCIAALVSWLLLTRYRKSRERYRKSRERSNSLVFELDHFSKPMPDETSRSDSGDKIGNVSKKLLGDKEVKLSACKSALKAGVDLRRTQLKGIPRSNIGDKVQKKKLKYLPRTDEEIKLLPCTNDSKVGQDSSKRKTGVIYQQLDINHKIKVAQEKSLNGNKAINLKAVDSNLKAGTCFTISDMDCQDLDVNDKIERTLKEIKTINKKLEERRENEVRQVLRYIIIQRRTNTYVRNAPV